MTTTDDRKLRKIRNYNDIECQLYSVKKGSEFFWRLKEKCFICFKNIYWSNCIKKMQWVLRLATLYMTLINVGFLFNVYIRVLFFFSVGDCSSVGDQCSLQCSKIHLGDNGDQSSSREEWNTVYSGQE